MVAVGSICGGKYRIIAKLGEGGMGAVFHAENIVTSKHVALKLMHAHVASNPRYVERFIREARAAAQLDHPNVLVIYDVAQEGQSPYLIMELLRGETLREYLKRNPYLEVSAFIALMLPAMDGVAAAHEAGVIHRDLKPDNIILARGTRGAGLVPKVVDFGIARLAKQGEKALTNEGATLGTPDYMSLEQLRSADQVDARTDIYAFGVMLYDAIAGRLPFEAITLAELVLKLATSQPPSMSQLRPDLPLQLTAAIDRSIARERDDRWPDLRSMIAVLTPFANQAGFRTGIGPSPRLGRVSSGTPEPTLVKPPVDVQTQAQTGSQHERRWDDDSYAAREIDAFSTRGPAPRDSRQPITFGEAERTAARDSGPYQRPASRWAPSRSDRATECDAVDSLRPHDDLAASRKTTGGRVRKAVGWVAVAAFAVVSSYSAVRSVRGSESLGTTSSGTPERKIATYEDAKAQVEEQMRQLAAEQNRVIHSPVCLIDANGDSALDVVGLTALASRGSAVVLDGRDGRELWRGGSYLPGTTLFCVNKSQIVLNDFGTFQVTIRDARDLNAARDIRLSDEPDRWGFGPDCMSIRTKDEARYDFTLSTAKPGACKAPVDVDYYLPESAMQFSKAGSKHLVRGDEHYIVEVKKPGTPILSVHTKDPTGWKTRLEYKNSNVAAVLAKDVVAVVGKSAEVGDTSGAFTIVAVDVATGGVRWELPVCNRSMMIQSIYADGPNIVFMEPWSGVWAVDAESGKVVWRSGDCSR